MRDNRTITIQGVSVPRFFYGTAWKEERTAPLTTLALDAGFMAIDTANQRKHYFEAAVGEAAQGWLARSERSRDDLFLQTKFTYERGQDHRLPYDPGAPADEQVRQSFSSSLEHLGTDRLDSYLIHGPETGRGLSDNDWTVWRTMEELHADGRVSLIGVSNMNASQLDELCRGAEVTPAFVQNRCYARFGWDADIRDVCHEQGVTYQGFSLLTANVRELSHPSIGAIAERHGCTPARITFAFALQIGMIPLTGTQNPDHMAEDLAAFDVQLSPDELEQMATIGLR